SSRTTSGTEALSHERDICFPTGERLWRTAVSFQPHDATVVVASVVNHHANLRRRHRRERKLPPRFVITGDAAVRNSYPVCSIPILHVEIENAFTGGGRRQVRRARGRP